MDDRQKEVYEVTNRGIVWLVTDSDGQRTLQFPPFYLKPGSSNTTESDGDDLGILQVHCEEDDNREVEWHNWQKLASVTSPQVAAVTLFREGQKVTPVVEFDLLRTGLGPAPTSAELEDIFEDVGLSTSSAVSATLLGHRPGPQLLVCVAQQLQKEGRWGPIEEAVVPGPLETSLNDAITAEIPRLLRSSFRFKSLAKVSALTVFLVLLIWFGRGTLGGGFIPQTVSEAVAREPARTVEPVSPCPDKGELSQILTDLLNRRAIGLEQKSLLDLMSLEAWDLVFVDAQYLVSKHSAGEAVQAVRYSVDVVEMKSCEGGLVSASVTVASYPPSDCRFGRCEEKSPSAPVPLEVTVAMDPWRFAEISSGPA